MLVVYRQSAAFVLATAWPLQDIAITNTVWCIAYAGGGSGGGHILRNSRAIVLQ